MDITKEISELLAKSLNSEFTTTTTMEYTFSDDVTLNKAQSALADFLAENSEELKFAKITLDKKPENKLVLSIVSE